MVSFRVDTLGGPLVAARRAGWRFRALCTAQSMVMAGVILALLAPLGCAGTMIAIRGAEVDIDLEMDILHACAARELRAREMTVERDDPTARVTSTTWEVEAQTRERVTVRVLYHPSFGPGVNARVERETWLGEPANLDLMRSAMPIGRAQIEGDDRDVPDGWYREGAEPADAALESEIIDATSACWERTRR